VSTQLQNSEHPVPALEHYIFCMLSFAACIGWLNQSDFKVTASEHYMICMLKFATYMVESN